MAGTAEVRTEAGNYANGKRKRPPGAAFQSADTDNIEESVTSMKRNSEREGARESSDAVDAHQDRSGAR